MKRAGGKSLSLESGISSSAKGKREIKPKARKCYYSVIHYLPSLVRGESVNIGVVLQCIEEQTVRCRVLGDLGKIRRVDPQADAGVIGSILVDLETRLNVSCSEKAGLLNPRFLHQVAEEYANHVQLTRPRLCVTKDLEEELNFLYQLFVGEGENLPKDEGASLLKKEIREALMKAGLPFQENVSIELPWETVGIDFGFFVPNRGISCLLQTVEFPYGSLLRAKEWAFNFSLISSLPAYRNHRLVCVLGVPPAAVKDKEGILNRAQMILSQSCHAVLLLTELEQWLGS